MSTKIVLAFSRGGEEKEGTNAWELAFKRFLISLLEQIRGERPNLVVLNGGEEDAEKHVEEAVGFVLVCTKSLLEDEALQDLCTLFLERKKREGNWCLGGRCALLKVFRCSVRLPDVLSFASDIISYDFYDIDVLTGEERTFDPRLNSPTHHTYWLKLSDVCYDLAYTMEHLVEEKVEKISQQRTIYLAPVGVDMVVIRDMLRRELIRRGYRVLPERVTPMQPDEITESVQRNLDMSILSIHLVGESYGTLLPGENVSLIDFQNKIAHEHTLSVIARRKENPALQSFRRLIWLKPGVIDASERQQIFIENLKSEAATIEEAEVMAVSIAEFKGIIRDHLAKHQIVLPVLPKEDAGSRNASVYLIYDIRDAEAVAPVASLLIDEGLEVLALSGEGSPAELRYEHQEHLRRCDASLIYLKGASAQWFGSRLQDIFKAPAFGREGPMRARAIFSDGVEDFGFSALKEHITVIQGQDGGSLDALRPFVQVIKSN